MFENIAARMSKIAADTVKEETLKSFEPVGKALLQVAPVLGVMLSTIAQHKKAKAATTIIINYFGGAR